jgi:hypothetical protein
MAKEFLNSKGLGNLHGMKPGEIKRFMLFNKNKLDGDTISVLNALVAQRKYQALSFPTEI